MNCALLLNRTWEEMKYVVEALTARKNEDPHHQTKHAPSRSTLIKFAHVHRERERARAREKHVLGPDDRSDVYLPDTYAKFPTGGKLLLTRQIRCAGQSSFNTEVQSRKKHGLLSVDLPTRIQHF